jgi:hypothetical protein
VITPDDLDLKSLVKLGDELRELAAWHRTLPFRNSPDGKENRDRIADILMLAKDGGIVEGKKLKAKKKLSGGISNGRDNL